ncbi:hypothetical protein, partial [Streptomyces tendae]|uniref:hypothetical protein n=1 Tax=Streptomyces tendae TaxID=1932 RepID=UPI00371F1AF2
MGEIVNSGNSLKGPMREARGSWILIPSRADKRRESPAGKSRSGFHKGRLRPQIPNSNSLREFMGPAGP